MLKERFLVLFLTYTVSRSLCDSENEFEGGESFIELELFQGIILQYSSSQCTESCWDIATRGLCGVKPAIGEDSPRGELTSCAWLGTAEACASGEGDHKILWVHAMREDKLHYYGQYTHYCPYEDGFGIYRIDGRYSSCNCDCFKPNWKIYLGELRSRESENYVITGIRFKLQDKILFLQPAERKLEADGEFSEHSWVPLPDDPSELGEISLASRNFFFDDLLLDPPHVLTGIRFEFMKIVDPGIEGFAITISGVPLDYETVQLDLAPENRQIVRPEPSTPRKRLPLKSFYFFGMTASYIQAPSLEGYNYVALEPSSFGDDFGQTTLPLFRSDPVGVGELSTLVGIKIFDEYLKRVVRVISLQVYPIV